MPLAEKVATFLVQNKEERIHFFTNPKKNSRNLTLIVISDSSDTKMTGARSVFFHPIVQMLYYFDFPLLIASPPQTGLTSSFDNPTKINRFFESLEKEAQTENITYLLFSEAALLFYPYQQQYPSIGKSGKILKSTIFVQAPLHQIMLQGPLGKEGHYLKSTFFIQSEKETTHEEKIFYHYALEYGATVFQEKKIMTYRNDYYKQYEILKNYLLHISKEVQLSYKEKIFWERIDRNLSKENNKNLLKKDLLLIKEEIHRFYETLSQEINPHVQEKEKRLNLISHYLKKLL